jgi:hypothetical protein
MLQSYPSASLSFSLFNGTVMVDIVQNTLPMSLAR